MASSAHISQMSVTPQECNNLSTIHYSCVLKDDTDAVLTSLSGVGAAATVIVTREDETAITASPITISYSAGKWVADSTLTGQAGVGRLKVVFKTVHNTNVLYSLPIYITVKGRMGSIY